MDLPTPPPARPRRRLRLAVSLRVMMVIVLVVGVVLARVVTQARAQREAVAGIERVGGWVGYDFEYSRGEQIPGGKLRKPNWLIRWIGVDYFHRVTHVGVMGKEAKSFVGLLDKLPGLESLWMPYADFTEEDLTRIAGHRGLLEIDISSTALTDDGTEILARLPNLRELNLSYTKITDRSIAILSRCRSLEELRLQRTTLTRKGFERLADLPSLRHVNLIGVEFHQILEALGKVRQLEALEIGDTTFGSFITAREPAIQLESLRGLTYLRMLRMSGGLDDEGLAVIGKMSGLEDLDVQNTQVTDQGLHHLKGLTRLKYLNLPNFIVTPTGIASRVTPKGIATLQAAMPWVKISQ